MNTITVNNKEMSKVEFFDYVYETSIAADEAYTDELYLRFHIEYGMLRKILFSLGWMDEYQQWVADGAGTKEASEELCKLLKTMA